MNKMFKVLGLLFFFYLGVVVCVDFVDNDEYRAYYHSFYESHVFIKGFVGIYRVLHFLFGVLGWFLLPLFYAIIIDKYETKGGIIK